MADLETGVRIKGDTRGLADIDRAARRTSDGLRRAAKEMANDQRGLNQQIVDTAKALKGVERGSDAYKKLAREMREVAREAASVRSALRAIDDLATKPRPGRGSFALGMGQGLGVAQYLPQGPGQWSRMGGAMVGRAIGRTAGGMAAPFMQPGMGGMSQMLTAIPVVGGAASGALSAAQGYYQQAVAFQRARLENLYFANSGIGNVRTVARAAPGAAQLETVAAALNARSRIMGPEGDPQSPQDAVKRTNAVLGQSLGFVAGKMFEKASDFLVPMPKGMEGLRDEAQRAISGALTGGKYKASIAETVGGSFHAGARLEQLEKRAPLPAAGGPAKVVDTGLGSYGYGLRMGFGMPQQEQLKGQFFGASGGLFDQGAFNQAMIAQRVFGVGMGASGALARGGGVGGGGRGDAGLLEVMGGAAGMGLAGGRAIEFLQELVDLQKRAEQQGVKISEKGFIGHAMALQAAGFERGQATRVAGGAMRSASALGFRGAESPTDLLMLRAAGWSPEQGAEGYAGAMNRLQEGGGEGFAERLLGLVSSGVAGAGGPEMQAMLASRALGKVGIQAGAGQLRGVLGSFSGGQLSEAGRSRLMEIMAGGARAGDQGELYKEAVWKSGIAGSAAVGEARLEAARIGEGGQYAGLMQSMQKAEIAAVGALGNFAGSLTKVSTLVEKAFKWLDAGAKGLPQLVVGGAK